MNPFESKFIKPKEPPLDLLLDVVAEVDDIEHSFGLPTTPPLDLTLNLFPDDTVIAEGEELGVHFPWIDDETERELFMAALKGSAVHGTEGVPGRRWEPKTKRWFIPIHHAELTAKITLPFFPDITAKIRNHPAIANWKTTEIQRRMIAAGINPNEFHGLAKEWYEQAKKSFPKFKHHQILTLLFLQFNQGKAIISDDPGTGKSAPALAHNSVENNRVIIVCPSTVKFHWAMEWKKWFLHNPTKDIGCGIIADVPKKHQKFWTEQFIYPALEFEKWPQVLIVSYDSLERVLPFRQYYNAVIFDECHLLKNYHTKRSKNALLIAQGKESIIALSGTPLKNRPRELFTVLNMIRPTEFPSWYHYAKRYCAGEEKTIYLKDHEQKQVLESDGASNLDELNSRIQSMMLRRTADEVLNLPSFEESVIEVDQYNYSKTVKEVQGMVPLEAITRLRQKVGRLKANKIMDLIEGNALPIVIFYHWKETGNMIADIANQWKLYNYERIDGTTLDYRRAQIVADFQAGEIDILLCSTLAGGVGINLTAAATAFLIDRELTLADEIQAAKRLHRIGQTKPVKFIRVHVKDSIDQIIDEVNQSKGAIAAAAIDGAKWEEKGIASVWKKLKKRK